MNTIKAILSRRSIRKFTPDPVPDEYMKTLLKAAMYAPSARNTQPWFFVVTTQRDRLNALAKLHPYAKMLNTATLAILVCGNLQIEPSEIYLIQNCSAATQNILLAANELELGSVWLGIQPRKERIEKMSEFFHLPNYIIPISLIGIGYPDERKELPDRFIPERISYEKFTV